MQPLGPSGLYSEVLKEGSEVAVAWKVDPEVNTVQRPNADLMLLQELQASPLAIVRRADEV